MIRILTSTELIALLRKRASIQTFIHACKPSPILTETTFRKVLSHIRNNDESLRISFVAHGYAFESLMTHLYPLLAPDLHTFDYRFFLKLFPGKSIHDYITIITRSTEPISANCILRTMCCVRREYHSLLIRAFLTRSRNFMPDVWSNPALAHRLYAAVRFKGNKFFTTFDHGTLT